MWTADKPEILGSLAKVDVLKDSISCGTHRCGPPMPCPFGTVVRGARRVERLPAGGGKVQKLPKKNKDPMDGAETLNTSTLANDAHAPTASHV